MSRSASLFDPLLRRARRQPKRFAALLLGTATLLGGAGLTAAPAHAATGANNGVLAFRSADASGRGRIALAQPDGSGLRRPAPETARTPWWCCPMTEACHRPRPHT